VKRSRSRDTIQTLKRLAAGPSSSESPLKGTEEAAGPSPPKDGSAASSKRVRQWFGASISQQRIELGTPLPPTQQSSGLFRTLAPSTPTQETTCPIASLSDLTAIRSSTTSADHAYLATRYRKGGKDSQDNPSTAGARVKLAAIQRDHRSRRRAGETVSLTPTVSQLGVCQSETAGEGIYACAEIGSRVYRLSEERRCEPESRSTTDRWHSHRRYAIEGRRRQRPVLGVRYRR
jgi:hypothetical protein